jgi:hypothetical protein
MAPGKDPEDEDRSPEERTRSEGETASEEPEPADQPDTAMTDRSARAELKDSFDRDQLIQRNIDMALDVVLRTNPAENILKNIDDKELEEQSRDQVQSMMNEWLDMYRDMLEEGRPLPRDLIGRSAELAEEGRKQEPRVSAESRGGRR